MEERMINMLRIPASKDIYEYWKLPLLPDYIKKWASITPQSRALIFAETGELYDYLEYDRMNTLYSMKLIELGIKKGDVLAVQMPPVPEFYFLMMACASIGAILAPIDMGLEPEEAVRTLRPIEPVAFLGLLPEKDFLELAPALKAGIPSLKYIFQLKGKEDGANLAPESLDFNQYFSASSLEEMENREDLLDLARQAYASLSTRDPHLILLSPGKKQEPKPALISHEASIINAQLTVRGVGLYCSNWVLLNVRPSSHFAGSLQPFAAWANGGCVVSMREFSAAEVLKNIEKYRPTHAIFTVSQLKSMWALPAYGQYDLSSLRCVGFEDVTLDKHFTEQLSKMAPTWYTTWGIPETAGYISHTPKGATTIEVLGQVGQTFPDLAKVSIRRSMRSDGTARCEVEQGEVGEICVEGPMVFLGYYKQPEVTGAVKTKEGILYLGEKGYYHNYGNYRGLRFINR
jgi:fatty-acyl-CoA synthase